MFFRRERGESLAILEGREENPLPYYKAFRAISTIAHAHPSAHKWHRGRVCVSAPVARVGLYCAKVRAGLLMLQGTALLSF